MMARKMRNGAQWSIMEALNWTTRYFKKHGIPSARLDAEVLLSEVLGMERIALYTHFDQPLTESERARYRGLIMRRINGEPVSYIRRKKEFWSRTLIVDRRVLIPRPETETVVEVVKKRLAEEAMTSPGTLMDMGCGSGALALAVTSFLSVRSFLVDIDPGALEVARQNCRAYPEEGPFFLVCADLFSAFRPAPFVDLIVSNPPYVRRRDLSGLPRGITDFEPIRALDGGEDGLEVMRRLILQSPLYLVSGGFLATEIAPDQAEAVADLFQATGAFRDIRLDRDLAGHIRVVSAWRN